MSKINGRNSITSKNFIINYQNALNNYSNSVKYLIKYKQIIEDIEKIIIGYKDIIKDSQKKLVQLKNNLIKLFYIDETYTFKNDNNIYPSINQYIQYLNNILSLKISSITNEINDLENKNIFKSNKKTDSNFINILQQNKTNLQNNEKKLEKNIIEFDNEYDKLIFIFQEGEENLRNYFVNKRKNNKDKIKENDDISKINEVIGKMLNSEEKFNNINLNFKNNNSNYFDSYDNYLDDLEKELSKNYNYLNNNYQSFLLIIFNNSNSYSQKLNDFKEKINNNDNQIQKKKLEIENGKGELNNEKENNIYINQDFNLFKNKNFNNFERKYSKDKYKVKAIKQTFLDNKLEKETKSIMNDLSTEFGFDGLIEEAPIVLTEEDVYEITKSFYGTLNFVDKTEYDLTIEKNKIYYKNLTKKLLYFGLKKKKSKDIQNLQPINDEEIITLSNSLTTKEYRMSFLQALNNYRTSGIFSMPQKEFDIFSKLFNIIADSIAAEENKDEKSTKFLLILSQTFFLNKENNEKYYLQKNLKGHKLFSDKNFWEKYIKNIILEEIEKLKSTQKDNKISFKSGKFTAVAFANILPFCDNMIGFGMASDILMEIIKPLYEEYQITNEMKSTIDGIISPKKK